MIVKMFQPQFCEAVSQGIKKQTIRPIPKRMPKIGDVISCRRWEGKPYRSKQVELYRGDVTGVDGITVHLTYLQLGYLIAPNYITTQKDLDTFAVADGFKNWKDLTDWFEKTHGLPFEAILIKWK